MTIKSTPPLLLLCFILFSCQQKNNSSDATTNNSADSSSKVEQPKPEPVKAKVWTAADIDLQKDLSYEKHSLEETYPYKDTTRSFQLEKIKEKLAYVEQFQAEKANYAVIQNHRNKNKEAALVKDYHRNAYTRISDTLGTERYQSAPLYVVGETEAPTIYGRDGWLVKLLSSDTIDMVKVQGVSFEGEWDVPRRYVKAIGDSVTYYKVAFVDVKHQNILTAERISEGKWVIRSMNPATSGQHKPPYAQETPVGMFVVQQKKSKMYYLKDGTQDIAGYAPYASRFTNGAYIHGVPTNDPEGAIIENSWSLGTIPRSHMCVRNASSHAKFVYDWAKVFNSLVIVID